MSAHLLGAAFAANMGTPQRKLVLLKLVDHCHDDGSHIFPAMATVAAAAQCSKRTVQREMERFLERGLLRLVREGGKGRGSTNEYALDLVALRRIVEVGWDAWVAEGGGADEGASGASPGQSLPRTRSGCAPAQASSAGDTAVSNTAKGDTVSPLTGPGLRVTEGGLRVTDATVKGDTWCHPNPQEEPLIEPSVEREARARDPGSGGEDHGSERSGGPIDDPNARGPSRGPDREQTAEAKRAADARFAQFRKVWPSSAADSKAKARGAFDALTPEEQRAAVDAVPKFLAFLKANKRDHTCAGGTYLAEKRWEELSEADAAGTDPARDVLSAKRWSRLWCAQLFDAAWRQDARRVAFMRQSGLGTAVQRTDPAADYLEALEPRFVAVPARGEAMAVWAPWFYEQTQRSFPDMPAGINWVFVPDTELQAEWSVAYGGDDNSEEDAA